MLLRRPGRKFADFVVARATIATGTAFEEVGISTEYLQLGQQVVVACSKSKLDLGFSFAGFQDCPAYSRTGTTSFRRRGAALF